MFTYEFEILFLNVGSDQTRFFVRKNEVEWTFIFIFIPTLFQIKAAFVYSLSVLKELFDIDDFNDISFFLKNTDLIIHQFFGSKTSGFYNFVSIVSKLQKINLLVF